MTSEKKKNLRYVAAIPAVVSTTIREKNNDLKLSSKIQAESIALGFND